MKLKVISKPVKNSLISFLPHIQSILNTNFIAFFSQTSLSKINHIKEYSWSHLLMLFSCDVSIFRDQPIAKMKRKTE